MPVPRSRTRPPDGALTPVVETSLVIGVLVALTTVVTFPLVTRLGHGSVGLVDPMFNQWVLGWVSDRLGHGGAGLFDAPIFYPYARTLAYSEPLLGIAVLVAPVYWATGNSLLTHNVAVLLSFVLAGAGMYLLARSLTGRRDAAMIAAVAFAFCPYRRVQMPLVQMLMSGWMPIAVWALRRYLQTREWPALGVFAVAFVLQSLTSVYFPYLMALPIAVIAAAELSRFRALAWPALLHLAIVACLVGAVLLPVALVHREALRGQDVPATVSPHAAFGVDVASYGRVDPRLRLYAWSRADAGSEGNLFPGATVLVLAAVALWPRAWPRGRDARSLWQAVVSPQGQLIMIAVAGLALSLGPRPVAFGHVALDRGPFSWLASIVPGLGALRVPARFGMVVHFALAALAAMGATRLLRHLERPWSALAAAVLVAVIVAEGYGAPLTVHAVRRAGSFDHRESWRWIRTQQPRPMIELPIGDLAYPDHHARDVQDGTLVHGLRLVNGSSRFTSEIQNLLGSEESPLADPAQFHDAFELLQQLRVGYIFVHPGWYGDKALGNATVEFLRSTDQVVARRDFGDTVVFGLRPAAPCPAPDGSHPLDRRTYRVTASHDEVHIPHLLDGDLTTGWSTRRAQQGGEWLSLAFDAPHDLAGVRLEMRASRIREYPRRLEIDASPDGRNFTPLFSGSVLPRIGAAFLRDTRRIAVDLPLGASRARVLRIRQVGRTTHWAWALQELGVWERDVHDR